MAHSPNDKPALIPIIGCIVVHIVGMLLTVIVLVKVVPTFEMMFAEWGSQLPAATQLVFGISNWFQSLCFLLSLIIVTGICDSALLFVLRYKTKQLWVLCVLSFLGFAVCLALCAGALYLPIFTIASST